MILNGDAGWVGCYNSNKPALGCPPCTVPSTVIEKSERCANEVVSRKELHLYQCLFLYTHTHTKSIYVSFSIVV